MLKVLCGFSSGFETVSKVLLWKYTKIKRVEVKEMAALGNWRRNSAGCVAVANFDNKARIWRQIERYARQRVAHGKR